MLAGLAAQTLTVRSAQTVWAFTIAIIVFTFLLVAAAVVVSTASSHALRPIRMSGPAVTRWSGYLLVAVGTWFVLLSVLAAPVFST